MRWLHAMCLIAGCGFRVHVANDAQEVDGPIDTGCVSACESATTLHECTTDQTITCPLGCGHPVDGDRCMEPVPSNGADRTHTDGAFGDLVVAADATLDTDTGAIIAGPTTLRAM